MRKPASHLTTTDLKAEAREYRASQLEDGRPVTHAQSLEMVARFHGFRDWNTASGVLPVTRGPAYAVSQRISGTYLKQPFTGTVMHSARWDHSVRLDGAEVRRVGAVQPG